MVLRPKPPDEIGSGNDSANDELVNLVTPLKVLLSVRRVEEAEDPVPPGLRQVVVPTIQILATSTPPAKVDEAVVVETAKAPKTVALPVPPKTENRLVLKALLAKEITQLAWSQPVRNFRF